MSHTRPMKSVLNKFFELVQQEAPEDLKERVAMTNTARRYIEEISHLKKFRRVIDSNSRNEDPDQTWDKFDLDIRDKDNYTLLMWATFKGHIEIVKLLLEQRADVTLLNNDKECALQIAAFHNHIELVELLLQHYTHLCLRPKFAVTNESGKNALLQAAKVGRTKIVKLLLQNSADIYTQDGMTGENTLSLASRFGHKAIVELILNNPDFSYAKFNHSSSHSGETALTWAIRKNHLEIVRLLLKANADPNISHRKTYDTPLLIAIECGEQHMVELLVSYKADLNRENVQTGTTPLHLATQYGQQNIIALLLRYRAKPNTLNCSSGERPIHIAANNMNTDIMQLLIKQLQYPHEINSVHTKTGDTALHIAAKNGDMTSVRLLLEHNANPLVANSYTHQTALYYAVLHGRRDIIKLLLTCPIPSRTQKKSHKHQPLLSKPYVQSLTQNVLALLKPKYDEIAELIKDPELAIHLAGQNSDELLFLFAVINNKIDLVKTLLENGVNANLNEADSANSIIMLAVKHGYHRIVEHLLTFHADPNYINPKTENTALYLAAEKDDVVMAKILLEKAHGIINPNPIHTRNKQSLLSYVCSNNQIEFARLLLNVIDSCNSAPIHYHAEYTELLFAALEEKHNSIAFLLLEHGATCDSRDQISKNTLLHIAAFNGDVTIMQLLLQHPQNLNMLDATNDEGYTPLQIAIIKKNHDIIKLLLKQGANPDCAQVKTNDTALHIAIKNNDLDSTLLLLDHAQHPVTPHILNANGESPLLLATEDGNLDLVECLLPHLTTAEINYINPKTNHTALTLACEMNFTEIATLLLQRNADIHHVVIPKTYTAFTMAVFKGNATLCALLIKHGANKNMIDAISADSMLSLATYENHQTVVQILLDCGANPNIENAKTGESPLIIAAIMGNLAMLNILLKHERHKANINRPNSITGETALHSAVKYGNIELVTFLLDQGADPNCMNEKTKHTPLTWAAGHGHYRAVEALLSHSTNSANIDFTLPSPKNTALDFAIKAGDIHTVQLLLKYRASLVANHLRHEIPPLILAVQNQNPQMVSLLLENLADAKVRHQRKSAIQYALDTKSFDNVCLLLRKGAAINVDAITSFLGGQHYDSENLIKLAAMHCAYGLIYEREHKISDAEERYKIAIKFNPLDDFVYLRLAKISWILNKADSIDYYRQAAQLNNVYAIRQLLDCALNRIDEIVMPPEEYARKQKTTLQPNEKPLGIDQALALLAEIYCYITAVNFKIDLPYETWQILAADAITNPYFLELKISTNNRTLDYFAVRAAQEAEKLTIMRAEKYLQNTENALQKNLLSATQQQEIPLIIFNNEKIMTGTKQTTYTTARFFARAQSHTNAKLTETIAGDVDNKKQEAQAEVSQEIRYPLNSLF